MFFGHKETLKISESLKVLLFGVNEPSDTEMSEGRERLSNCEKVFGLELSDGKIVFVFGRFGVDFLGIGLVFGEA